MCTGIQDGYHLGWKLAAALAGEAADTYETDTARPTGP
jgi:hypothetical protein